MSKHLTGMSSAERESLNAVIEEAGEIWGLTDELAAAVDGLLASRDARLALCGQCGEMLSAMVKVGTSDGWCVNCLDEAAETKAAERLAAVEALVSLFGHPLVHEGNWCVRCAFDAALRSDPSEPS